MKKLLLLLLWGTLFTSCINDSTKATNDPELSTMIENIEIPFREHGYSQHSSKVLSSQEELDSFLTQVGNDESWNNKTDFLAKLQDTPIDFSLHNLLFYRITEPSGSIKVVVENNTIAINNNEVTITIERTVPDVGTADMAYYAVAYKVAKSIESITFKDNQQKIIIDNKKSDMIIPKNCKAWFDGCNYCSQDSCTKMNCIVYRPQEFKCTKWNK